MHHLKIMIATAMFVGGAMGCSCAARTANWSGDGGVPAFYRWTDALPDRPGVMLRAEAMEEELSLPHAARAERILYSSVDWRDAKRIVTVSGGVFFPHGKVPKGGWPVIAWAHGTTGIADVCAPSFNPRSARDRAYLGAWLDRGFAIVATDYQGLGTPGVHPYLQYRAEGQSVLDSLRAALDRFPELSRDRLMTMGQSQGGEGAIAAAYLAPGYAPELKLRGTVATGVVAHTANVGAARQMPQAALYADPEDSVSSAYETLWFLGTAQSIDPDRIRPEEYLTPEGLELAEKAQRTCMGGLVEFAKQREIGISRFYRKSTDDLEKLVTRWTDFPDAGVRTPVFIGAGLADEAATPAKQYNFASAMCSSGSIVEMHFYPGADHSSAVERSLADSPAFVRALMKGQVIRGNCAKLQPPQAAGSE